MLFNGNEVRGWIYKHCGRYVFLVTDKVRRTKHLAREVLNAVNMPATQGNLADALAWVTPATVSRNGNEYSVTGGYFEDEVFTASEIEIVFA